MNNEPVAWMSSQTDEDGDKLTMFSTYNDPLNTKQVPLYTHPVKELTDEEILQQADEFVYTEWCHDKLALLNLIKFILREDTE